MPNASIQEKINNLAELALRYFRELLKEKLGNDFSETILTYLPLDKINLDAITSKRELIEFRGTFKVNIIKDKVEKLANKTLKDLRAAHPAKIKFAIGPASIPYPSYSPLDPENNISLRLTYGFELASNKQLVEIAVFYLIIPTGENVSE